MEFEWDPAKSERNRAVRGLAFDLAAALFAGHFYAERDNRRDYGEVRMRAIGTAAGLVLACVYTDRGPVRRIVSLRLASRRERNVFRQKVLG